MANFVSSTDLLPCDVLLYHGTGFIDKLIQYFDGSEYYHAAIYNGNTVLEAVATGVVQHTLVESVKDATYVDVYRFISSDHQKLGDEEYPIQPILERITAFAAEHDRYAFEQLILLALLCSVRKQPIPVFTPIIRMLLDHAAEIISKIIAAGKEPMICSELVYRCFAEAAPAGKYTLGITGLPSTIANSVNTLNETTSLSHSDLMLEKEINEFLHFYNVSRAKTTPIGKDDKSNIMATSSIVVSDFVTPRDLKQSPNLYKVGTLKI